MSPVRLPGASWARGGRLVAMVRADSIRETCCSSERTPRVVVAITEPIATSEIATTASATSTSMRVNPAVGPSWLEGAGDNFDPSRQPVHAHLVAGAEPGQHDGAAAGRAGGEKADGRARRALIAAQRQRRLEADVVGNLQNAAGRPGTDGASRRVDLRGDLGVSPQRRGAVRLEQRRGLQRIG